MTIRLLRTLVAIADTRTFSDAAKVVHVTHAAVSQQMQALEQELDTVLFDRSTRPSTLTAKGQQMVESARQLLAYIDDTKSALAENRVLGTLNIGSVRTSALAVLPQALVKLNERFPDLRIKLRVGYSESMLADVVAGRLDAAIVAEHIAMPSGLDWRPFIREPLVVIAPPGAPPDDAGSLLTRHPYIRFASNVPLANIIDTELARARIHPREVAEIDTVSAMVSCVAQGLGVAIVPQIVFRSGQNRHLVTAPFGEPQIYRQIGMAQRQQARRSAVLDEFQTMLAEASAPYGVY